MKMKTLSFAAAALFSNLALADGNVTLKTGLDYTSGTYGTNTTTEITSIPFVANYETGNWSFKATVPYVRIKGADNVIAGVGVVRRAPSRVRTESGLGDITTAATYSLLADPKAQLGIDITGKIKWGTADSARGLGTGENDYWLLIDPYKTYGNLTLFGGAGYGILGSSDSLRLKNVVSANLGVSYKLNEKASIGTMYDYRTKSADTGFEQRELTAFYTHKLSTSYKLQAYATQGFSDGSPDWGAGANIGYNF